MRADSERDIKKSEGTAARGARAGAERCRERGKWSAETLKWRREGDGRIGERGLSPWGELSGKER